MLVLVRYNDENYDIVEDYCLEYLIVTGKVVEFSRSDQWVTVGTDPIREQGENVSVEDKRYAGPERRNRPHRNLLHTTSNPATT